MVTGFGLGATNFIEYAYVSSELPDNRSGVLSEAEQSLVTILALKSIPAVVFFVIGSFMSFYTAPVALGTPTALDLQTRKRCISKMCKSARKHSVKRYNECVKGCSAKRR